MAWVRARLGVPHDSEHIATLCGMVTAANDAGQSAFAKLPVLVHTMAYVDKTDPAWRFQQQTVSRTFAWAVFEFKKV